MVDGSILQPHLVVVGVELPHPQGGGRLVLTVTSLSHPCVGGTLTILTTTARHHYFSARGTCSWPEREGECQIMSPTTTATTTFAQFDTITWSPFLSPTTNGTVTTIHYYFSDHLIYFPFLDDYTAFSFKSSDATMARCERCFFRSLKNCNLILAPPPRPLDLSWKAVLSPAAATSRLSCGAPALGLIPLWRRLHLAPLSSKVRLLVNRDAPCFSDDLGMSEYFSGDGQLTHTTEEQCDRIELDRHFVGWRLSEKKMNESHPQCVSSKVCDYLKPSATWIELVQSVSVSSKSPEKSWDFSRLYLWEIS